MKHPTLALLTGLGVAALAAFAATAQTNQPGQYNQAQTIRHHADLEMSAAPLDHEQILQLQHVLQDKGFEPGPPDGTLAPEQRKRFAIFRIAMGKASAGSSITKLLRAG